MSCRHCQQIRDEQRRFLDENGETGFGGWMSGYDYAEDVVDSDGQPGPDLEGPRRWIKVPPTPLPRWSTFPLSELADCRCDCHMVARIGGLLPRLEG